MNLPADHHVLPVGDLVDHDEDRACWCAPRLETRCPECNDPDNGSDFVKAGHSTDSCFNGCIGGWVAADPEQPWPVLVIHNAADGRK